jgi:hypothetical protein
MTKRPKDCKRFVQQNILTWCEREPMPWVWMSRSKRAFSQGVEWTKVLMR